MQKADAKRETPTRVSLLFLYLFRFFLRIVYIAGDVPLEHTRHTGRPVINRVIVHLQTADHLDYLVQRHAVTQHTGDEARVVPELAVELITQSLYRGLETARVNELKIVPFLSVRLYNLDDLALGHGLG